MFSRCLQIRPRGFQRAGISVLKQNLRSASQGAVQPKLPPYAHLSGDPLRTMLIKAKSAGFDGGNLAEITINDKPIEIERNEHNHYRGLHIAIINPVNGNVETARAFDTYITSELLDQFIKAHVPEGYIVAAACKDECHAILSDKVKLWFSDMGSEQILNLGYREAFAFIGVNGRKDFNEKKAK